MSAFLPFSPPSFSFSNVLLTAALCKSFRNPSTLTTSWLKGSLGLFNFWLFCYEKERRVELSPRPRKDMNSIAKLEAAEQGTFFTCQLFLCCCFLGIYILHQNMPFPNWPLFSGIVSFILGGVMIWHQCRDRNLLKYLQTRGLPWDTKSNYLEA